MNSNTSKLGVVSSSDKMSVLDLVYPIGSIYFTIDSGFDPNISWGGYGLK